MRSSAGYQVRPEALLRNLIREQLLSEVPLDFIGSIDNTPEQDSSGKRHRYLPSIGHDVLKDEENRNVAVDYFKSTKDSWAIVTLGSIEVDDGDQSLADSRFVDSKEFKSQLWDMGLDLERTNVIVVIGVPYQGDYKDVKWSVVHDIVGHSIDKEVSYRWSDSVKQAVHFIYASESKVWESLPEEFQIADTPSKDDIRADIAASIFLGAISEDKLSAAASAGFDRAWNLRVPDEGERDVPMYRWFMAHFKNDKEKAREWFVPQFTNSWMRAIEIWKGKFDREGGRVRAIIPF